MCSSANQVAWRGGCVDWKPKAKDGRDWLYTSSQWVGCESWRGHMEEVGQMVWHHGALPWFIGAQERSHCCSEAAARSVQREGALLLSEKQMKRFDCRFWSKGSLGCCREETESCRQRSRRSSPVAWISQKTSCTSETPRELITRLTLTTVFAKALPSWKSNCGRKT